MDKLQWFPDEELNQSNDFPPPGLESEGSSFNNNMNQDEAMMEDEEPIAHEEDQVSYIFLNI